MVVLLSSLTIELVRTASHAKIKAKTKAQAKAKAKAKALAAAAAAARQKEPPHAPSLKIFEFFRRWICGSSFVDVSRFLDILERYGALLDFW